MAHTVRAWRAGVWVTVLPLSLTLAFCREIGLPVGSGGPRGRSDYPSHLAMAVGQRHVIIASPLALLDTSASPPGIVTVTPSVDGGSYIVTGVRRGFAEWHPRGPTHPPVSLAVTGSLGRAPVLVGHRGASAIAPENTLASIEAACAQGFSAIEIDVRFTRDSVPVLLHDRNVGNTSNGVGNVDELPLAELRALDFGSWYSVKFRGERIPTLREALSTAAACGFDAIQLDLKSFTPLTTDSGLVHVVRVATEAGVVDRVQLAADLHTLRRATALAPGTATLVFGGVVTADFAAAVIQSGISAVGIRYADYSASSAQLAVLDSAGVSVGVWAPPGALELNALEPAPHFVTAGWAWLFPR